MFYIGNRNQIYGNQIYQQGNIIAQWTQEAHHPEKGLMVSRIFDGCHNYVSTFAYVYRKDECAAIIKMVVIASYKI